MKRLVMSNVHLQINSYGSFADLETARAIGSSIKILLGSGDHQHGAIYIYDPATGSRHDLVKPTFDRSKVVVGGQEMGDKATKFINYIETNYGKTSLFPVDPEGFWEPFLTTAFGKGELSVENFLTLVEARLTDKVFADKNLAREAVMGAVADYAQKEAAGELRNLEAARNKEAKFAAQAAKQGKNKKK